MRWLPAVAMVCACSTSSPSRSGLDQPLRVRTARAQFFPGTLPRDGGGPSIVTLDSQNNKVVAGTVGKVIGGNAGKGAFSVAMRFPDLGTGYWVVPVDELDPLTEDQVTWRADLEIAADVPLGPRKLWVTAIDERGNAGPLYEQDFDIVSPIPAGHVVMTLKWDTAADLDLVVFTPDLKRVDSKHPNTAIDPDAGVGSGVLDHDSNAGCMRDGFDQEDLVFSGAVPSGEYQLGATMVSACGVPATTYTITVRVDGNVVAEQSGRFVDPYDLGGTSEPVAPILKVRF